MPAGAIRTSMYVYQFLVCVKWHWWRFCLIILRFRHTWTNRRTLSTGRFSGSKAAAAVSDRVRLSCLIQTSMLTYFCSMMHSNFVPPSLKQIRVPGRLARKGKQLFCGTLHTFFNLGFRGELSPCSLTFCFSIDWTAVQRTCCKYFFSGSRAKRSWHVLN